MVNPTNNTTRALEQAVASGAVQVTRKGVATQSAAATNAKDTAELSSTSQDHAVYLSELKKLPDVRPEEVALAKRSVGATIKYPPLDVIAGIGKLVGKLGGQPPEPKSE